VTKTALGDIAVPAGPAGRRGSAIRVARSVVSAPALGGQAAAGRAPVGPQARRRAASSIARATLRWFGRRREAAGQASRGVAVTFPPRKRGAPRGREDGGPGAGPRIAARRSGGWRGPAFGRNSPTSEVIRAAAQEGRDPERRRRTAGNARGPVSKLSSFDQFSLGLATGARADRARPRGCARQTSTPGGRASTGRSCPPPALAATRPPASSRGGYWAIRSKPRAPRSTRGVHVGTWAGSARPAAKRAGRGPRRGPAFPLGQLALRLESATSRAPPTGHPEAGRRAKP